jgi:hypothetical protein
MNEEHPETVSAEDADEPPGLDPSEQHNPQMHNKDAADACLERWRSDMPQMPSTYRPSGRVPAQAVVAMALGALIGVVGATLTALGIGALTVQLLSGIAWVMQRMKPKGKALVAVFGGGCVALVGGYALMYALVGLIAARCTTGVGQRLGKLRSPAAAAVFSILAVAVSLMLLHAVQQNFSQWCDPGIFLRGQVRGMRLHWLVRVLEIAGAILAVTVAGWQASGMIRSRKFCDSCELFMVETDLPEVGLGGLRILTAAVNASELEAVHYLFEEPPAGKEGKAVLFQCPNCGEGFLETHAQFHASWTRPDGNKGSKETSWMTGSVPLAEKEIESLKELTER